MSERTPRNSDELIAILKEEVRLRRENRRLVRAGSVALVAGLLLFWGVLWYTQGLSLSAFLSSYGAFFLVALGGVAVTGRHRQALLRVDASDTRLAGFLTEALEYREADVGRHAEGMLAKLLPKVTVLDPVHVRMLARRLSVSRNQAFVASTIAALRRFGDAPSLPALDEIGHDRRNAASVPALEACAEIRLRLARQKIDAEARFVGPPTFDEDVNAGAA